MPSSFDLTIENISQLVTCDPSLFDSSDETAARIGLIDDACVAISDGAIAWVGRQPDFEKARIGASETIGGAGLVVLPGLVDAHTHAVFAGTREREYEMRIAGATYMEIAGRGGGINSTVREVRKAPVEDLVVAGLGRLAEMLRKGTTTVEIKSGYGLSLEAELKMLEVIRRLGEQSPVDVVATFLGAHDVPAELRDDRARYVDIVLEEMIPAVGEARLAEFCDVFCEEGVFTAEEARRILLRGKDHGLKPKIHADEFADSGGARVAADVGAVSAGHLVHASLDGLEAMRSAGTVAVLLPGVSVGLAKLEFADARRMLGLGLDVAIATDFNPGSSMVDSLPIVSGLACSFMKMAPADAILGMTISGAMAIGRQGLVGSIVRGKKADLVLFGIPDFRYIPYHFGGDMVRMVVKDGHVVFDSAQGRSLGSRINEDEA